MLNFKSFLLVIVVSLLASCGGGGSSDSDNLSESDFGIRVLHGSIETFPIALYESEGSQEEQLLQTSKFADRKGFTSQSDGEKTIILKPDNSNTVLSRSTINVSDKDRWNYLVYGDRSSFGLRTALYKDILPEEDMEPEETALNFVHSVVGASQVRLSITDTTTGIKVTPDSVIAFGGHTQFTKLPAGNYTLIFTRVVDNKQIHRASNVELLAGKLNTALITGEYELYTKLVMY